jgi:hypothetical protein
MTLQQFFGIASALILLSSNLPYAYSILKHGARPNRVSWFGWALLSGSSALIQITHQPDYSVLFVAADAVASFVIFALALRWGVTEFTRLDKACLLLGCASLFIWLALEQPLLALVANIIADICFGIPTIVKTFRHPQLESRTAWGIASGAMFLGLLSKTDAGLINTLFPVFLFVMNFTFFALCTDIPQRLLGRGKMS